MAKKKKGITSLQDLSNKVKEGIIFEVIPWPKEVWILEKEYIEGEIVSDVADGKQCVWGHVNNEVRRHMELNLHQAQLVLSVWHRHFGYVGHILKTKFPDKTFMVNRQSAVLYNAAWATLGYTEGQEPFVIKLAEASMPTLRKFSPGTYYQQ